MGLRFVGGPYDGMEIDHSLINKYARVIPVNGDVGVRLFVLMPENPRVWERLIRGEEANLERPFPYERVFTSDGGFFFASPPGTFDRALSQAKLNIHARAKTALDALSGEDRRRVIEAADELQHHPPEEWPKDKVTRISADEPMYLLSASPDLRAFIRVLGPGSIELFDIVREEALRLFLDGHRAAGARQ